jgi:hypothetical protein
MHEGCHGEAVGCQLSAVSCFALGFEQGKLSALSYRLLAVSYFALGFEDGKLSAVQLSAVSWCFWASGCLGLDMAVPLGARRRGECVHLGQELS